MTVRIDNHNSRGIGVMEKFGALFQSRASLVTLAVTAALGTGSIDAAAQAQSADAATLEEVLVTARKRDEALVDVPLSVSVVSPETIETQGIQNITDMFGKLPSLFYAQNRAFSANRDFVSLVVRGVGANPALEPSTGVFIDGVYQPSLGFDAAFLDVERVELLRGPQGALFGRNTEGGALNIVTRKPGEALRGSVSVVADDLRSVVARGSLSGPVVDGKVYAGLAAQGGGTDGWIRNTFLNANQNSDSSSAARVALRFTPSEALEVNFSFDDTTRRGKSMGVGVPATQGESFDVAFDFPSDFDTHYSGAALTVDYRFAKARLTSQTGYRDVETQYTLDFDAGPTQRGNFQFYNGSQKVVSQELRLATTTESAVQWLGGVYLYQQKDRNQLVSNWGSFFGPTPADGINDTGFKRDGYSVFASVGVEMLDGLLDLTAGLRYTNEKADATRFSRLTIPGLNLNSQRSTPRSATFTDTSPSLQASLDFSPAFKPYINVAKGFKSGGWERIPTSTSPFLTLQPETAINYEIGLKGGGSRFFYSLAAYRVEIEDMHTPTLILNPDTGLNAATIASAGEAHTSGVELEGTFALTDNFDVNLSAAWTTAKFDEFIDSAGRDRAGDDIPNVPDFLANVGLEFRRPLASGAMLVARGNARYVSSYFSGLGTSTDTFQFYDSYTVFDLDLGFDFDRFRVGLFVKNATDEYVITSKFFNNTLRLVQQVAPPRTVGLRASFTID
jgi:iron complex outermembrane receptor protein